MQGRVPVGENGLSRPVSDPNTLMQVAPVKGREVAGVRAEGVWAGSRFSDVSLIGSGP